MIEDTVLLPGRKITRRNLAPFRTTNGMIDPYRLWSWSWSIARQGEQAGKGTRYPTVRQAAKHFRCSQMNIRDAVHAYKGNGTLGFLPNSQGLFGNFGVEASDD